MTSEEKLRALLAEAQYGLRTYTKDERGGSLSQGADEWLAELHRRIDTALAEPVESSSDRVPDSAINQAFVDGFRREDHYKRERDEARAEVERLRDLAMHPTGVTWGQYHENFKALVREELKATDAAAYQRGAEAMREAAILAVDDDYYHQAIRNLTVPEDKS